MTKDTEDEIKSNAIQTVICIGLIFALSVIAAVIPFATYPEWGKHDFNYHLGMIRSMVDAMNNGHFGSRILGIIGQDYGYGSGFFYSLVPSAFAAILIKCGATVTVALCIEFTALYFLSGLVLFYFLKRIFNKKGVATIGAMFYVTFPYFLTNLHVRFAFGEMFLMLAIPLIAWGLYELIYHKNYRAFFPLFVGGYVIAVFSHFMLSVYVTIFVVFFILINAKRFFKNYNFVPFTLAVIVLGLIGALYYIPMLVNYGGTTAATLNRSPTYVHGTAASIFWEPYLVMSAILVFVIYFAYLVFYFATKTEERTAGAKQLLIMSTFAVILLSPACPWELIPGYFTMIQFAWRLFIINALTCALMLCAIINKLFSIDAKTVGANVKRYFNGFGFITIFTAFTVSFVYFMSLLVPMQIFKYDTERNGEYAPWIESVALDTYGISENWTGGSKNGDYYPTGTTNDYLFSRANSAMVYASSGVIVTEFAHYQSLNNISFMIIPTGEVPAVTLKIPFAVYAAGGVQIQQLEVVKTDKADNKINELVTVVENNAGYTKINLSNVNYTSDWDPNCKVIISYTEQSDLKQWLIENPFEFINLSGSSKATNFIKTGNDYTVSFYDVAPDTVVELPTFFYKGYELEYKTLDGTVHKITGEHGENGLMTVKIGESGTLNVKFTGGKYMKTAHILALLGVILFVLIMCFMLFIPRKTYEKMEDKMNHGVKSFAAKFPKVWRMGKLTAMYLVATILDFGFMAAYLYYFNRDIMTNDVMKSFENPTLPSVVFASVAGFLAGIIFIITMVIKLRIRRRVNVVDIQKGPNAFSMFILLTTLGMIFHGLAMWLGFGILSINKWLVKLFCIVVMAVSTIILNHFVQLFHFQK